MALFKPSVEWNNTKQCVKQNHRHELLQQSKFSNPWLHFFKCNFIDLGFNILPHNAQDTSQIQVILNAKKTLKVRNCNYQDDINNCIFASWVCWWEIKYDFLANFAPQPTILHTCGFNWMCIFLCSSNTLASGLQFQAKI